jgi:hypothetical protein
MVFPPFKANGAGLSVESPKVGIIILALVATASLLGGLAGWQIRQHAALPETITATPSGAAR